jgi:alpha-glucosidase
VPLSRIEKGCERPLVVEYDTTQIIALGEAKLIDYARMKFDPDSSGGISIRSALAVEVKMSVPFQSAPVHLLVR